MPRFSHTLRASSALALVVGGLGLGLSAAVASTVPDAVTDVRIDETTAATWSQLRLHLDWRVPDGTSAGDTFVLTLPEELEATAGTRFRLRDEAGATVAQAVVAGRQVTFTMTDYAQNHTGVHGSAWFWVEFADGVAPGDSLDLRFDVDSVVFRDQIRIERPRPGNPTYPSKWQRWTSPEHEGLLWAVDGPVVQPNMVGSSYEITDTPGPGQRIDCNRIDVFTGTRDDTWATTGYIVKSRLADFSCTPSTVRIVLTPTADQVGQAFRLLGRSMVTDPSLEQYRNTGVVRLWGKVTLPVSNVIHAGGGGNGTGLVPPAATSAPTGTATPTTPTLSPADNPTTSSPPAQPAPGPSTAPGTPATTIAPTATSPGHAVPTQEPIVTVTLPETPVRPGTTPRATMPPVPTTTVVAASPRPAAGATPKRIDTGVPQQGMDLRVAGAGGAIALASGVGLIALSRRGPRSKRR